MISMFAARMAGMQEIIGRGLTSIIDDFQTHVHTLSNDFAPHRGAHEEGPIDTQPHGLASHRLTELCDLVGKLAFPATEESRISIQLSGATSALIRKTRTANEAFRIQLFLFNDLISPSSDQIRIKADRALHALQEQLILVASEAMVSLIRDSKQE